MFLKSRAGAAKLGTPLMVLCFLAIGGFLYWLSITAEPTTIVVEEVVNTELTNAVAFADFSAATDSYMGQVISLEGIDVTSLLGPQAFWTSLEDAQRTAYLLHFSEAALADSVSVMSGNSVTVTGMVTAMSDSILDAWEAAGAFPQENDRLLAEFAEDFIEVSSVSVDGAEADEGSDSSS
jgi:hypothetical protein